MNLKTVRTLAIVSFLLLLAGTFACIKRVTPIPPPVPPSFTLKNGLILYLPFNGSIADSSGNGNVVTLIDAAGGGALTADDHGNANSAWGNPGNGSYLAVTNNGSIKFDSAFSISYNVMVNSYQRQAFVTMVDLTQAFGPSFSTGLTAPGLSNFLFGANDSSGGCDNTNDGVAANVTDTSSWVPNLGVWYNVISTYRKGAIYEYVNGIQVGHTSNPLNTSALLCPNSTVNIGAWWNSDLENLNGTIDEVRLYNRVLTVDEISALAKNL